MAGARALTKYTKYPLTCESGETALWIIKESDVRAVLTQWDPDDGWYVRKICLVEGVRLPTFRAAYIFARLMYG